MIPRICAGLLILLVGTKATLVYETTCFFRNSDGLQESEPGGPCGVVTPNEFFTCCAKGDFCLEDGICQWDRAVTGNSSGYYIGGCTDASMKDASCNTACSDQYYTDVVYNTTTGIWACCGTTDGEVTCNTPTGRIFDAPAPEAMSSTWSVGNLSTASSPSATALQTTTSAILTTTTSQTGGATATAVTESLKSTHEGSPYVAHDGLSTGGIIAVAVVCGLLVLGCLLYLLLRYRRKKQQQQNDTKPYQDLDQGEQPPRTPSIYSNASHLQPPAELEHHQEGPRELSNTELPIELASSEVATPQYVAELGSSELSGRSKSPVASSPVSSLPPFRPCLNHRAEAAPSVPPTPPSP